MRCCACRFFIFCCLRLADAMVYCWLLSLSPAALLALLPLSAYGFASSQYAASSSPTSTSPLLIVAAGTLNRNNFGSAPEAALASAFALSVRDVLQGTAITSPDSAGGGDVIDVSLSPPPPAQPIVLFAAVDQKSNYSPADEAALMDLLNGVVCFSPVLVTGEASYPSVRDYDLVIKHCSENPEVKPILHSILDGAAAAAPLLSPAIRDGLSFVGIQCIIPKDDGRLVHPDVSRRCGDLLQQIVDISPQNGNSVINNEAHKSSSVAISLELPAHLSMLQANCLPKSLSALGDSFLVCNNDDDDRCIILASYLYQYDNPFGGTDPLSSPTKEITILSESGRKRTSAQQQYTHVSSAAYTALRGYGMGSFPAACIAKSVENSFIDCGDSFPQYSWDTINDIAMQSQNVRAAAVEGPVLRKKYIEFGYK